ncbi:MAG TPA: ComEC/Rec2 family competence protein [Sphingobium sp.]|uniref:ComEC/Rec2 family competence protein n=1 Tax=Sphingobium sp. TaxID=1912891 RepID=UPI002ED36D50
MPGQMLAGVERWLEVERAQLPLWSPVALGIGIFGWFALPARADWMLFVCLCLAGATLLLCFAQGIGRLARTGGIGLLLMAAGCLLPWGKAVLIGGKVLARPVMVRMDAAVTGVEVMSGRGTVRLLVRPIERPDLPDKVRINLAIADLPGGQPMRVGDRLRLRVRLMPPAPPSLPGGYDYARKAWFDGIGATGRIFPPVLVTERTSGTGTGFRTWLSDHVAARVKGGPGALAVTMATGDRGRISPQVEDEMRQSGLTHLLSISGVHVTALIGGVVFLIYRLLALSTRLALRWPLMLVSAAAGAGAGIGYTLLTGAEVPTIRSCVTALLVMAGLALGREAISLRLLACGALLVMVIWPEAVIGPSFQLSFAAVATILALYEHPRVRAAFEARDEPGWARLLRFLGGVFATGVAVEAVLMPIVLYHFHKTGLLGSLANMVAIPLTEFVVMPAEAAALALDAAGMGVVELGAPAWWVVEQALGLLLALARGVAAQTAMALTPAISPWAFAFTLAGLFWMMLWRTGWRWAGLPVALIGLTGYVFAPLPDVLVSSDGRHVALRTQTGALLLLRDRAGDYMRYQMAEHAAFGGELGALADWPGARCSDDFCMADIVVAGRPHRILMTRSRLSVPWAQLVRSCAATDIIIADRRLPDACRSQWLKLDRRDLGRFGGAAIMLASGTVRRSRNPRDEHPWVTPPPHRGP